MNKKRILIIDDEPSLTRLVKWNLEATGKYKVREENLAGRALAAARTFNPDLILLDVMMPQQLGGDVAAGLKADENLKHVPVVFLSAAVRKERVQEHGGVISGYPFLAKPVDLDEVIACIEKYARP